MKRTTKPAIELLTRDTGADRIYAYGTAGGIILSILGLGVIVGSFHYAYITAQNDSPEQIETKVVTPFPVGVNPSKELITEQPDVESYFYDHLSNKRPESNRILSLLTPILGKLSLQSWYQNLASAGTRILVIQPGERKEQIALNFQKIFGWTEEEAREFLTTVVSSDPVLLEGSFAPGTYVVEKDAEPNAVARLITDTFKETVVSRYPREIDQVVPLEDTLTVASLLEREAYDFEDMRHISGVIWNRLFIDMRLQIDASLQYVKGTTAPKTWWPKVIPDDKYLESPYNTYAHEGLPPTPIANPSVNAILAALNPRETDCYYYFHDADGGFHCTQTYEEHVKELTKYYGQGR